MKMHWYGVVGALAVVVGLGTAGHVKAEAISMDIGVFGSYLDSSDLDDEAFGAGGKLKLELAEFFAIDVRGSYLEYDNTGISVVPVEAAALLQIPLGALNLYGGVGAGYYFFDADRAELDDNFGFFPLAGLEVALGDIKLFGEVRWLMLSTDVDSAGDELEGIVDGDEADVDGIGVNIGLAIDL